MFLCDLLPILPSASSLLFCVQCTFENYATPLCKFIFRFYYS